MDHVERTRVLLGAERLDAGVNGRPSNVGGGLNSWSLSLNLTPPNASRYRPLPPHPPMAVDVFPSNQWPVTRHQLICDLIRLMS